LKTLLIDNYDSFTFNIYQYLAEINGETPIVIRNDEMSWHEVSKLKVDNIVISPGPGRPELPGDFGVCGSVIRESNLPILGICLGHQGIGHIFGGRIRLAPEPMHGRLSKVVHSGEGIFRGLPSPFQVVRYHSLVVDPELPEVLQATAWTEDGVLMGLAHRSKPIWGVQFHPESICSDYGHLLLENFRDFSQAARPQFLPRPTSFRQQVNARPPRLKLRYRRLGRFVDPEAVFGHHFVDSEGAYWLHSALIRDGMSRFSFMGDSSGPMSSLISYRSAERRLHIKQNGHERVLSESIFDFLARDLDRCRCENTDLPFDFVGGFVGYFGYELKQECGGEAAHRSSEPDAAFIFADRFVAFDHVAQEMYLVALTEADAEETSEPWFDAMEKKLADITSLAPPRQGRQAAPIIFRMQHSKAEYMSRIETAMREITAGETYEVCLTNKLVTEDISGDHFSIYRILQRGNPAPFSAFLKFPEATIMSSSPERFLSFGRDGLVQTKPIKGTIRRGINPDEDFSLKSHLSCDEKSRAENLMIVDLLRNDLGRVCETGSVRVPKLMDIETYATVHQMVSTVQGQLAPDRTVIDCVKSAFPGGSMTGAPKVRTMSIIDQLEGKARGIYSGSIGYLSLNGAADLNIVIRTIVAANKQLSIGVGGAIVALSDVTAEFEETMLKAQASIKAIVLAQRGSMEGEAYFIDGMEDIETASNLNAASAL
jgi:para-aminobenzoate synthetase